MQKCSIYFYLTLLASGFMVHFWIWNITMKCHIIKCSNYKKDNMRLYQANCKQPPVLSFFTKSPITRLVLKRHSSDTFVLSFKQLWDKNRAFFSNEQCCHPDGAWSQADISDLVDWPFYYLEALNELSDDTFLLLLRRFSINTPANSCSRVHS